MKGPLICKALIARPFFIRNPTLDRAWQGGFAGTPSPRLGRDGPASWSLATCVSPGLLRGRLGPRRQSQAVGCTPFGLEGLLPPRDTAHGALLWPSWRHSFGAETARRRAHGWELVGSPSGRQAFRFGLRGRTMSVTNSSQKKRCTPHC